VFPYDRDFAPLQKSLLDLLGVEIKPVFDFYAINKATYDGYTSNARELPERIYFGLRKIIRLQVA